MTEHNSLAEREPGVPASGVLNTREYPRAGPIARCMTDFSDKTAEFGRADKAFGVIPESH